MNTSLSPNNNRALILEDNPLKEPQPNLCLIHCITQHLQDPGLSLGPADGPVLELTLQCSRVPHTLLAPPQDSTVLGTPGTAQLLAPLGSLTAPQGTWAQKRAHWGPCHQPCPSISPSSASSLSSPWPSQGLFLLLQTKSGTSRLSVPEPHQPHTAHPIPSSLPGWGRGPAQAVPVPVPGPAG